MPFVDDPGVELVGCEAAGEGLATGRHGAPLTIGGRGGVLHGSYSAIMQDEDGQITEAHSISAGLDYPGVGPEHAWLRDSGRARYEAVTDEQALDAFARLAELEGIIPALESSHAVAWVLANPPAGDDPLELDLPVRPRRQGPGRGAGAAGMSVAAGRDTIAAAFASTGKRAALMPYLMGGFPSLEGSVAIGEAYAEAGADLVELGVPFSDPLADGPVIHAAGTAALAAGADLHGVLEVGRSLSPAVPVVLMCYANLVLARGPERFAHELAERGIAGLIVPDLPLEEAGDALAACDASGVALVALVAPTTPAERLARIGASARGFVYTVVRDWARRASARACRPSCPRSSPGPRRRRTSPWRSASASGRPEAAAQAADAGADGVIVGSRLVRAAAESPEPAAAVRDLVTGFAEALTR